jgi:hypothetical protein
MARLMAKPHQKGRKLPLQITLPARADTVSRDDRPPEADPS